MINRISVCFVTKVIYNCKFSQPIYFTVSVNIGNALRGQSFLESSAAQLPVSSTPGSGPIKVSLFAQVLQVSIV